MDEERVKGDLCAFDEGVAEVERERRGGSGGRRVLEVVGWSCTAAADGKGGLAGFDGAGEEIYGEEFHASEWRICSDWGDGAVAVCGMLYAVVGLDRVLL